MTEPAVKTIDIMLGDLPVTLARVSNGVTLKLYGRVDPIWMPVIDAKALSAALAYVIGPSSPSHDWTGVPLDVARQQAEACRCDCAGCLAARGVAPRAAELGSMET